MPHLPSIAVDDFDYVLPTEKIASFPNEKRDHSKLLIYKGGEITDANFFGLAGYLPESSALVLNNSRVISARLQFYKESGGAIEIFCLEPSSLFMEQAMDQRSQVEWKCLVGGAAKWKEKTLSKKINIDNAEVTLTVELKQREKDHFIVLFSWDRNETFASVLACAGAIPLPPYIKRTADREDSNRYQTVFAQNDGSVAAPTAALHFTHDVFQSLRKKNISSEFVTLHVGAGTFKPMKSATADAHQMHSEPFSVSIATLEALINAHTITAVGTTSLRTLESLYWLGLKLENGDLSFNLDQWEAYTVLDKRYTYRKSLGLLLDYLKSEGKSSLHCRTSLMILPGYHFKSADALITNFHQPRSTLLLLIAAFIGENWKKVYTHALENDYRFLSYGDSSLLWRKI